MNTNDFSHGLMGDGAAILKNGNPMTIEEIVAGLSEADKLKNRETQLEHSIQDLIYEFGVRGMSIEHMIGSSLRKTLETANELLKKGQTA